MIFGKIHDFWENTWFLGKYMLVGKIHDFFLGKYMIFEKIMIFGKMYDFWEKTWFSEMHDFWENTWFLGRWNKEQVVFDRSAIYLLDGKS